MFCKICERLPFQHRLYGKDEKHLESIKDLLNDSVADKSLFIITEAGSKFYEAEYHCPECKRNFLWMKTRNDIFHFGLESKLKSPHLKALQELCFENSIAEAYRGESPYGNDPDIEWTFFYCLYDEKSLRKNFLLPETITYSEYFGFAAGADSTFYDPETKEGLMGMHPQMAEGRTDIKILR